MCVKARIYVCERRMYLCESRNVCMWKENVSVWECQNELWLVRPLICVCVCMCVCVYIYIIIIIIIIIYLFIYLFIFLPKYDRKYLVTLSLTAVWRCWWNKQILPSWFLAVIRKWILLRGTTFIQYTAVALNTAGK